MFRWCWGDGHVGLALAPNYSLQCKLPTGSHWVRRWPHTSYHTPPQPQLPPIPGALAFEPANVTIKSGESIKFVNNAGFPHNVVFDEDAVPVSVNCV